MAATTRLLPVLATMAALFLSPARAAIDGELGPTSTGQITITATIEAANVNAVRVSGASDLVLPTIDAQADAGLPFSARQAATTICLYHTAPRFSLQVTQAVPGFSFLLNGPGEPIPFRVAIENLDVTGGATSVIFNNGASVSNLVSNRESETCATGPRAVLSAFRDPVPANQRNGAYSGVVSIIMAAE